MKKHIYLAGGCFWGTEKYLALIPGVLRTEVGYANGATSNPSYEDVCNRATGHAETVLVEYDPATLELSRLLSLFYRAIDPVSINRQGDDRGDQYRMGIYYTDEGDLPVIQGSLAELQKHYDKALAVECEQLKNYYPAEEYHQKYLDKNPGGYCHISPALFKEVNSL
ncbi:MAG: peptide-methionine (S)-S-oxide reductase MsrA [Treponema sp.]|jgi:peptide methionine sulfoxide reductase msrA/msrB|nr:peptide-methionine (S)-S-oxide reductase MsrA [Treponema sp.]